MSTAVLVSPAELDAMMKTEKVVLIDTRDADTYAAGHIPGAVNVREVFTFLATSSAEGLAELKETFAKHLGAAGSDLRNFNVALDHQIEADRSVARAVDDVILPIFRDSGSRQAS